MDSEDGGGRENGKESSGAGCTPSSFTGCGSQPFSYKIKKEREKKKYGSFCIGFALLCFIIIIIQGGGKQSVAKPLTFHKL